MAPCPHLVSPDKRTLTERCETEPSNYTADLFLGSVHSDFCMGHVIANVQMRKGEGGSIIGQIVQMDHERDQMSDIFIKRTSTGEHERKSRWSDGLLYVSNISFHPSTLPVFPPPPSNPFLYATHLSLLFCSSTCFLTHPYIALALPALRLTRLQASFTSLINTPVLLIRPCPVLMGGAGSIGGASANSCTREN